MPPVNRGRTETKVFRLEKELKFRILLIKLNNFDI